MSKTTKLRAQVKSRFYYLFWGVATLSVVAGQVYVANGFRRMAESNDAISADINLLVESVMFAVPQQQEYYYEQDPMIIQ